MEVAAATFGVVKVNDETPELELDAASDSPVLFVHGWPDGPGLWSEVLAKCKRAHSTRKLYTAALPNCAGTPEDQIRPWGATFEEVALSLVEAVEKLSAHTGKAVYVGHDWGSILGILVERICSHRLESLVCVDVGADLGRSLKLVIGSAMYQIPLALGFVVGGSVGDFLAQSVGRQFHIPSPELIKACMGSFYYYMWTGRLLSANLRQILKEAGEKSPRVNKSDTWLEALQQDDKSKVLAVEAGHWVFKDRPEVFQTALDEFLST